MCYARLQSHLIKESNLYIAGIPRLMSEQALFDLFCQYGTIINCRLLYDKLDKNRWLSKGTGFVRYNTSIEAHNAIVGLNGVQLKDADVPLCVKLANSFNQEVTTYVLYICNFPWHWKSISVHNLFSTYASVYEVHIICRGKNRYGFVTVGGYANAISAIYNLNGRIFDGYRLTVAFKTGNVPLKQMV